MPSVLADDELWGPPPGARRPYQARRSGSGATAMSSPPWTGADDAGVVTGGAACVAERVRMDSTGEAAGAARPPGEGRAGAAGAVAGPGVTRVREQRFGCRYFL